jgi:hypothetical protein
MSQKFGPIDATRFLLSDSCRSVARSLSSNHSIRASSLYASTEVGTWLLSVLTFSRSRAFSRVVLVPVLSLICLAKNNDSARPVSRSHVVSRVSARDWIASVSLNVGQSLISPEKWSGLSLSSPDLPGAMLTRGAAAELGSGTGSQRNGARPSC